MAEQHRPIQCANCLYPLDQPTVVVNGTPYCCSGCAQGGPCICSYGHLPVNRQPGSENPDIAASPLRGLDPPEPSPGKDGLKGVESGLFTRMVENMIKEVEITRQVVKDEPGPVKDLLTLLEKSTRLLQAMAHRLDGTPQHTAGPSTSQAAATYLPVKSDEPWERINLVVENATKPDIAFSYTRALAKLESVGEIKLMSINQNNLLYRVETRSKAKFARQVMSLPDYRPVRIQASLDEISVLLDGHPGSAAGLEKLLSEAVSDAGEDGPNISAVGPTVEARPAARKGSKGVMEAGIDGFFNARHYLIKDGEPGPVEMRSWRVEISLEGDQFDDNGMLSGFDRAQEAVEQLMVGYNNKLLNKLEPYDEIQPTPENIARTLYEQLKASIADQPLRVKGLKVWASPTQYVWYSEPPGHGT